MKVNFEFEGTVDGDKMTGTREIKMAAGGGGGAPGGDHRGNGRRGRRFARMVDGERGLHAGLRYRSRAVLGPRPRAGAG